MSWVRRIFSSMVIVFVVSLTLINLVRAYIPTGRDTLEPEETYTYEIKNVDEYELISENKNFKFYYREDRDIIAIHDLRNGYFWTTGLDLPIPKEVTEVCNAVAKDKNATIDEILEACQPYDARLNEDYTHLTNSLLVVEYFDVAPKYDVKRLPSASPKVTSRLLSVEGKDNVKVFEVKTTSPDLTIKMRLTFTLDGIEVEIKDSDITGEGQNVLASLIISPFLGASGGMLQYYDPFEGSYDRDNLVPKNSPSGYVFVPDGPGALIRFNDYITTLKTYNGNVYGVDPATDSKHAVSDSFTMIPIKSPTLPVFGVTHGDDTQAAFVAYAISGDEYMEIICTPEENTTYYTWVYPRFIYNTKYFRVYNLRGDGYFRLNNDRYHYDIRMNYDYLANDGSEDGYPASYVGMALKYRDFLLENDFLHLMDKTTKNDIPLRLDFIMSDSKKSVLGYEDVIVTTAKNVSTILNDVLENGITNVNSGLYGFQAGGITLGKPYTVNWSNDIGSYNDFKKLINEMKEKDVDISFSQDYVNINGVQVDLEKDSTVHLNEWFPRHNVYESYAPITEFYYTKPTRSAEWARRQTNIFKKMGAMSTTVEGIPNMLVSDYNKRKVVTLSEAKELANTTLSLIREKGLKVNALKPNLYVLNEVDRNLQMDVFSSQFIIQTDTVPFVQLVLHNTMEMYASYSNFSFYTISDALRMIDYNVSPSFVVSQKPSYLLSKTNSMEFYSTEYVQYAPIIQEVYQIVNNALSQVINKEWVGRKVIKVGLIENTYDDGTKIIINYTENQESYGSHSVDPLSYLVVGGN